MPTTLYEKEEPLDAADIRKILLSCNNRRLKAYLLVLASGGLSSELILCNSENYYTFLKFKVQCETPWQFKMVNHYYHSYCYRVDFPETGVDLKLVYEGQGTIPGAVTAITVGEIRDHIIDTQISLRPALALQQTQPIKSETIQNAGELYRSDANWYCRDCKQSGDKFYIQVHICKGYTPT